MMASRKPERVHKPDRRVCLQFDRLELLQLLSAGTGVHHSLGAVIAPSVVPPRVQQPGQIVDPHVSINNYMSAFLRPLPDGLVAVLVPLNLIPPNAPPPTSVASLTGAFANVFASSGALIVSALNSGLPLHAPNAPATVPGLRLARLLAHERSYPLG